MKKSWQLQEAKNRLSEVIRQALSEGPQVITRHGEDMVMVIAVKEFERLLGPKDTLLQFFRRSPLGGMKLDVARDKDTGREVDFVVPR